MSESKSHCAVALLILALTVTLTWPIAATLDQPCSVRSDYYSNIWNAWWFRTALLEEQTSPYFTDYLHAPQGVSLSRHTLSPVNAALGGALGSFLNPFTAINLTILLHFALSAFSLYLLAHYLTGHRGAAILAGLIYSFNPFHSFNLAQTNIASLEFPALALLCFLRTWRDGGWKNMLLTALVIGLVAASSSYYLVYIFLLAALLVLAGKLLDHQVGFLRGLRNLSLAALPGSLVVILVAWPLLSATLFGDPSGAEVTDAGIQPRRVNDLLGFNWVGLPDRVVVSWPTMLGYSTLLLLLAGIRGVLRQPFWLLTLTCFLVLSLGVELKLNGADTGIWLPYAVLQDVPVLSMLRKPDRCFMVVQMMVALLAGFAWRDLSGRVAPGRWRLAIGCGVGALILAETCGAPYEIFKATTSPLLERLAADADVESIVDLPAWPGRGQEGCYLLAQVTHGKRIPQGYTTNLALTDQHQRAAANLRLADQNVSLGNPERLLRLLERRKIDRVILHKTFRDRRVPVPSHETTVWAPFCMVKRELVWLRQVGLFLEVAVPKGLLERRRNTLTNALGAPVFEDEWMAVFKAP